MAIDIKRNRTVFASNNCVVAADFHPTEPWLLTSHASGYVKIYNLDYNTTIHTFKHSATRIYCVKFIPRKNWYVVGSNDKLFIFNCITHEQVTTLDAHKGSVRCLAVHPIASILLSASEDKMIKAWDWDNEWHNIQTYQGHTNWVRSMAINPKDPDTFASASADHTVKMWSISSPAPNFTIEAHDGYVQSVDFYCGTNKLYLVTSSSDQTIKIWDYLSQKCVQTITGHTATVMFAVFHPKLPIIISGDTKGTIKLWSSASYGIQHTLNYEFGWAWCIALREDTTELAVGFERAVVDLELELARSLDDRAITSGSAPSTTPYQQCSALAIELITDKAARKLISDLTGDTAHYMVDFLSKMVSDEEIFTQRERKYSLYLLSKLAKSAEVFPQSLELEGVICNLSNCVAAGGYGFIYRGQYEGSAVCVKAVQIEPQGIDQKKMRAQASELTIWAHVNHRNILPFLGIYLSKEDIPRICIVSPWMFNGDLPQYLDKVPDAPRKPLVCDILSGLQYLHDLDIIHADLKAKNVLVSAAGKAMLADFGISRLSLTLTTVFTNAGIGTAYWMAPELLLEGEPASRESDIWAFACTCYEIITLTIPFKEYRSLPVLIGGFMRGKIIPSKPTPGIGWDEDVWSMAMKCWKADPASRPKVHQLLDMINSFDYPDNRPFDPESHRRRNDSTVEYDRILGILNQIRQSTAV